MVQRICKVNTTNGFMSKVSPKQIKIWCSGHVPSLLLQIQPNPFIQQN